MRYFQWHVQHCESFTAVWTLQLIGQCAQARVPSFYTITYAVQATVSFEINHYFVFKREFISAMCSVLKMACSLFAAFPSLQGIERT